MANPQEILDLHQKVSYLPDIHRVLPQAPDAERGVLSSFLLSARYVGAFCKEKGITEDHFHHPGNSTIFALMMELFSENELIDFISLTQILRDRGELDQVGGAAYITELFTFLPTAANVGFYVEVLEEKFILREIIKVGTEYAARSYDEQDDVPRLLNDFETGMLRIIKLKEGKRIHSRGMSELVAMALDQFEIRLANRKLDMPTGIPALDFYTDGLVAPEVTFIQAKPSDGKTAISLNIAEHLAIECRKKVGYISAEMGDIQLVNRLIFSRARINPRSIKRAGRMEDWEREEIEKAATEISSAPIFIRDDGGLTIAEISATAASWKSQHGLDVLMIDHLQLIKGNGKHKDRTEEVEFVSNALKPLAKRLEVPIVVLSQVTEGASGEYKIKQSRAAEADADNIWTLSHKREAGKIISTHIYLSKQRDRDRDISVPLVFDPEIQRFSERDKTPEAEQVELVHMTPAKKARNPK